MMAKSLIQERSSAISYLVCREVDVSVPFAQGLSIYTSLLNLSLLSHLAASWDALECLWLCSSSHSLCSGSSQTSHFLCYLSPFSAPLDFHCCFLNHCWVQPSILVRFRHAPRGDGRSLLVKALSSVPLC